MLNKSDRELLKKLRQKNSDDLTTWNYVNLLFPIIVIAITLIVVVGNCFYNETQVFGKEFFLTLFNGSLPLTAINILLLGVFSFLKYNKQKEIESGIDTNNLRTKLFVISTVIILISWLVYISQALISPIENLKIRVFEILISIALIAAAWFISNLLLLLQEDFMNKALLTGLNISGEATLHQATQTGGGLLLKRQ